ncbi:MAG TPA: ABC transporter substrate-binding protein, partial [Polyangia bacterium]|nr:ABC transporter substrate-binding protein [Polyangia bacterium]
MFRSERARRRLTTALAALAGGAVACAAPADKPAAHIGIVIGPAGTQSAALRPVYDWAIAAVNKAGGAGGRQLEAKYFEMTDALAASTTSQETLAAQMLGDPDLVAVAGLFSFAMAPKFVVAKVPYITPETADDDVFRAFHDGGYVWRTLESDSTMLWFMLAEAKGRGDKSQLPHTTVGLLTSKDSYGSTFFDWYGFHATELGLTALSPVQYDQSQETCEAYVDALLDQGVPDFLIAVPSGPDPVAQATCMVRTLKARGAPSTVLLSDSVHVPGLITALGADAEGLSGYSAAPDPTAGFSEAFTNFTHVAQPPEHAANALDAIALLAYGLEKTGGVGRQALDAGMRAIVDGQGTKTGWQDFKQALSLIHAGQSPDVSGASGPLVFDHEVYTDPTSTFFDRWAVENGAFTITHHVTTESEGSPNVFSQSAVARGLKALQGDKLADGGGTADLPPLHDNWALVIATSATWQNYRHQADAL